jgi:hypothetical protein
MLAVDAIKIERMQDEGKILATLRHPRIFPHISDDGCPDSAALSVVLSDAMHYLGAYRDSEYHGLFLAHPHNLILWEVHTCLLPTIWGPDAKDAAKACARWLWSNTPCKRIITCIPEGNRLAARLAALSGMRRYGINPKSIQKNGRLVDQELWGMDKEQACQQPQ